MCERAVHRRGGRRHHRPLLLPFFGPGRARIELSLLGRAIEADFGPSQIRTFRVPAGGGAISETDLIEWDLADGPQRLGGGEAPSPPDPGEVPPPEPDPASSDATPPAERTAPSQRCRDA